MTTYREFVKTHIKSCPGRSWPEKMKACAAMWRRQKGRGKGLHVGGKCGASVFDNFRDAGRNLSAGPRVKIGDNKFAKNFLKSAGRSGAGFFDSLGSDFAKRHGHRPGAGFFDDLGSVAKAYTTAKDAWDHKTKRAKGVAGGRVKHVHQPLSRKMHHKLFGARGLRI
jgi:hypothetical protein